MQGQPEFSLTFTLGVSGLGGREGISAMDFYPLIKSYEDIDLELLWATSHAMY